MIFDLHCDTLSRMLYEKCSFLDFSLQASLPYLQSGNYKIQCLACFVNLKNPDAKTQCNQMIEEYHSILKEYSHEVMGIQSSNDLDYCLYQNKLGFILTMEELGILENKEDLLQYYKKGVRMICISWNYPNHISYPNYEKKYKNRQKEKGLTPFGKEIILEMERLGIVIDLSHASDQTFKDCIEILKEDTPIVLSHSCINELICHPRNAEDWMLKEIQRRKGIIGINYYSEFCSKNGYTSIEDIVAQIQYCKDHGYLDIVALGSDFDGIDTNLELKNASDLPKLIESLQQHGFTEEEIYQITFNNAYLLFKRVI